MISKSKEEYLKIMYVLNKQNGYVRVTDVAKKIGYSKASVNKALYSLKENNLVCYESYGKIELTKEGENLARKILEAYDIVYVFLKDVLNMEKEKAKVEAEKMKLALSDDTLNNLARYVHKVLGLDTLDCCYDINKEKCRVCSKRKIYKVKKISQKGEKRYGKKVARNK